MTSTSNEYSYNILSFYKNHIFEYYNINIIKKYLSNNKYINYVNPDEHIFSLLNNKNNDNSILISNQQTEYIYNSIKHIFNNSNSYQPKSNESKSDESKSDESKSTEKDTTESKLTIERLNEFEKILKEYKIIKSIMEELQKSKKESQLINTSF